MYAIIRVAGRQYRAVVGEFIDVDRLPYVKGKEIVLDEVLLFADGETVKIGQPIVKDVSVKATVEEQFRGERLIVWKYRQRTSYRRKSGHRQFHTRLRINDISLN